METPSQESISQSEKSTTVRLHQRSTPKEKITLETTITSNRFTPLEHMDTQDLEGRNWTPPKDMCPEDSASGEVDWTAPKPPDKQSKVKIRR